MFQNPFFQRVIPVTLAAAEGSFAASLELHPRRFKLSASLRLPSERRTDEFFFEPAAPVQSLKKELETDICSQLGEWMSSQKREVLGSLFWDVDGVPQGLVCEELVERVLGELSKKVRGLAESPEKPVPLATLW